jgi:hypothetical protein
MISRLILGFLGAYSSFYLLRAVITGKASVFRNRPPSTRLEHPKEYWGFVAMMAAGAAIGLFFVLRNSN